uniref:Uncharacterized protein n=1 Tax=Peronospora matthiolae TaxID=2874970 RepID=A0AAV1SZP8_9STRA
MQKPKRSISSESCPGSVRVLIRTKNRRVIDFPPLVARDVSIFNQSRTLPSTQRPYLASLPPRPSHRCGLVPISRTWPLRPLLALEAETDVEGSFTVRFDVAVVASKPAHEFLTSFAGFTRREEDQESSASVAGDCTG